MLDGAGDHMTTGATKQPGEKVASLTSEKDTLDGVVTSFGTATGEENLIGLGPEQSRHLSATMVNGVMSGTAQGVGATGVAEDSAMVVIEIAQIGKHRPKDFRINRSCRVVIEINWSHDERPFDYRE